jgi:hypothetical protein
MYSVSIRTNHPWQVRATYIAQDKWSSASKSFETLASAECEIALLMNEFETYGQFMKDLVVDFKISSQNYVWGSQKVYGKAS